MFNVFSLSTQTKNNMWVSFHDYRDKNFGVRKLPKIFERFFFAIIFKFAPTVFIAIFSCCIFLGLNSTLLVQLESASFCPFDFNTCVFFSQVFLVESLGCCSSHGFITPGSTGSFPSLRPPGAGRLRAAVLVPGTSH